MNFKYYIYKQSNLGTSFNKYSLSDYVLVREITQCTKWSLKIQRESEWFTIIRRNFSGAISVKGTDFDTLIATEGDTKQYAVVITKECSGVYSEWWKGFFSYFDFKVDLDRCTLSFEPKVWDKYSPVYDQLPIERNVLTADSDFLISLDGYEFPTESMPYSTTGFGLPGAASWTEHPDYPGDLYYLYSQTSIFQEWVGGFPLYEISNVYKRNYYWMPDNVTPPSLDPQWIALEQNSVGNWKWIRPYEGYTVGTATYNTVTVGLDRYETLNTTAGEIITLTGCKRLQKILEYFATYLGLTYVSNFFNDSPCPMGGSTLDWTIIQQISNLRATEDPATKGMMTLQWLLTQIRNTFNVYWYIDLNGDFRLEHRKYFDNGKSYAYTHVIPAGNDLSVYPENIKHLRRYEWSKPDLFRYEKLELPYSLFDDWTDASIEYPQLSILGNETNTITADWGTDIISMYDSRDELPKQGWVLLNVNLVDPFYKVINEVGALSGNAFQNARFSNANLYRDLWTYGRLLTSGKINGVTTTLHVEKLRKQVELNIPECCQDLDYEALFRTPLGDGWLESGESEQSGNLKLNLIYE